MLQATTMFSPLTVMDGDKIVVSKIWQLQEDTYYGLFYFNSASNCLYEQVTDEYRSSVQYKYFY